MLFKVIELDCALKSNERVLGVLLVFFLESLVAVFALKCLDDVIEGFVLAQQFLALAAALYGVSAFHEDGHLFEKLILPILAESYFIFSLEWRCALLY